MPLYEYVCRDCDTQSELLVQGSQQPECPKCGSVKLTKLLSVVASPGRDASAGQHAREPGRIMRLGLRVPSAGLGPAGLADCAIGCWMATPLPIEAVLPRVSDLSRIGSKVGVGVRSHKSNGIGRKLTLFPAADYTESVFLGTIS